MKKAIWTTFYHKCSTNEKPQHIYCPSREDSWYKLYRVEVTNKLAEFNHDPPLYEDVQKTIKPIYEDLSPKEFVRMMFRHIQNNNENFNAIIWRLAPKHLNCGSKMIESYSYLAAGIFNKVTRLFSKL